MMALLGENSPLYIETFLKTRILFMLALKKKNTTGNGGQTVPTPQA